MFLTETEQDWFQENENDKKNMLGQIFTPEDIADLMVSMIKDLKPGTILDPCFGEGVFLNALRNKVKDFDSNTIGIELDPDLYNMVKSQLSSYQLYNKDFFDFNKQVDCIIMNPPYIRHELLHGDMPKFLNKGKILKRISLMDTNISPRSNLYIYFFIKSWLQLKENGEIVAIIPNTWMSAEYGQTFKEFLLKNFWLKSVIQFNKDVFPNADVESCIIHLKKQTENSAKETYMVNINNPLTKNEINDINQLILNGDKKLTINKVNKISLCKETNWLSFFNKYSEFDLKDNLVTLDEISSLKRGTTTNYNDFFVKNVVCLTKIHPEYFIDIVCSPKDIEGYSTNTLNKHNHLFLTDKYKRELPTEIKEYVEKFEKKIIGDLKPKTLLNKINNDPDQWFNIKNLTVAPIIFSYIIRERKKFIINEGKYVVRDNFYEITPKNRAERHILFAILNSRITSLFLEDIGRSHGKGLLKIQKYELDKLRVINPKIIKENDKKILINLGQGLSKSLEEDSLKYISKIDKILLPYVSTKLNVNKLEILLEQKLNSRLNRKSGYLKLTNK